MTFATTKHPAGPEILSEYLSIRTTAGVLKQSSGTAYSYVKNGIIYQMCSQQSVRCLQLYSQALPLQQCGFQTR